MKTIPVSLALALSLSGCVGYGFPADGYGDSYGGQDGYADRYPARPFPADGGDVRGVFRCESTDHRPRECPAAGGRATMIRQLSKAPCIEGRTWGRARGGVWVSQGCRAEFATDGYGDRWGGGDRYYPGAGGYGSVVRCESSNRRTRRCDMPIRSDVQLTRQLSRTPCLQGRTWGWDRGGIWVSQGCRAEFSVR